MNVETLRYYERRGIIPEPDRSLGGHRLYPEETVTTLRVIKAAQNLGFTLDEVAELLEAGRHRHGDGGGGPQSRTEAKLAEVDQKIADLQVIRASLVAARDAGCDDLVQCAESDCCPIPFVQIGTRPRSEHGMNSSLKDRHLFGWDRGVRGVLRGWSEEPAAPEPQVARGRKDGPHGTAGPGAAGGALAL